VDDHNGWAEALMCRVLVELVTEYLEGALSPEDRARFDQHIAECADCTAHLDQMRRTLGVVGRLTEGSVPTDGSDVSLAAFRDWRRWLPGSPESVHLTRGTLAAAEGAGSCSSGWWASAGWGRTSRDG
jgi:anti-sigma factor RsiW